MGNALKAPLGDASRKQASLPAYEGPGRSQAILRGLGAVCAGVALLLGGCVADEGPEREPRQYEWADPAMQNALADEVARFVERPCDNWLELLRAEEG